MHHSQRFTGKASSSLLAILFLSTVTAAQQAGTPQVLPPATPVAPPATPARGNAIVIPINQTHRVQMRTKKKIIRASNPKEQVARVQPVPNDPTSVLITGLDSGLTQITLVDESGAEETVEILVQLDIEYLRTVIQRAVPTANVTAIPGTNDSVILAGTVNHAEEVDVILKATANVVGGPEKVINEMRVGGVQQVQLDVIVARVERELLRRMSFDFISFGQRHVLASTTGGGFTIPTPAGISGTFPGGPIISNLVGTPNAVPANIFGGIFGPDQDFFFLMQALKDEKIAKILAQPRLTALSGRDARLRDGGQQAIPVPSGLGQVGIEYKDFGTSLKFLPIVLGNGRIHLEVEPEVSSIDPSTGTSINGTVVPGFKVQNLRTTVEIGEGETLVLGGILQHTLTGLTSKTPILGELPIVGAAFSRKSFDETEFELIVIVTPHLVDAMSCDQLPKLLPGQETRSPDDFELFLEGILEAPRGPRDVCQNGRYVPAYQNGPTAALLPCGGRGPSDPAGGVGCGSCASSPQGCNYPSGGPAGFRSICGNSCPPASCMALGAAGSRPVSSGSSGIMLIPPPADASSGRTSGDLLRTSTSAGPQHPELPSARPLDDSTPAAVLERPDKKMESAPARLPGASAAASAPKAGAPQPKVGITGAESASPASSLPSSKAASSGERKVLAVIGVEDADLSRVTVSGTAAPR
jgi:pilus assembly protein CpaC